MYLLRCSCAVTYSACEQPRAAFASGMSIEDIEEYLASGRLEPNLHIFTNELHPLHESAPEQALQASWLAFLAAKNSSDPRVRLDH